MHTHEKRSKLPLKTEEIFFSNQRVSEFSARMEILRSIPPIFFNFFRFYATFNGVLTRFLVAATVGITVFVMRADISCFMHSCENIIA